MKKETCNYCNKQLEQPSVIFEENVCDDDQCKLNAWEKERLTH